MKKILTVPSVLPQETVYVCGNHCVSLPHIDENGRILALNVIRMDTNSLIEFFGTPLFCPSLRVDQETVTFQFHQYENDFIPSFQAETDEASVTYRLFAPEKYQGFVMMLDVDAKKTCQIDLALQVNHQHATRTIFRQYPLNVDVVSNYNEWTKCHVLEYVNGSGIAAVSYHIREEESILLQANEHVTLAIYFGVGAEADGATLHNMDLQRRSAETLYQETIEILKKRHIAIADERLSKLVNLNLNYCFYFSLSHTIDTQSLVAITSRSHRYYVSSAFWARDVYLWAFPAIVLADVQKAREVLMLGYQRYLKNIAYHALYINGNVLYPGFELDELMAVLVATNTYVRMSNDHSMVKTDAFKQAVQEILHQLSHWFNAELGLYRTELDPSDDPVSHQYLCHNNTLVYHVFVFLNTLGYAMDAQGLKAAIYKHFVIKHQGQELFAYSVDTQGKALLYDNPPGSLMTLPYYGLLDASDALYQNTVAHYWSKQNTYYYEGQFHGQGGEHAPHPWPMSLCNRLLSEPRKQELLDVIKNMTLDNGIACETVDRDSGIAKTGAAFATFAGYFAYAIAQSVKPNEC